MPKPAETPHDADYLWAKSGYDMFIASCNLTLRFASISQEPFTSIDLVKYMSAYTGFAINQLASGGTFPDGVKPESLRSVDTILRRIDKGILGISILPEKGQLMIKQSLLRGINEVLCQLLSYRAAELEILINHMQAEDVSTTLVSTDSPYYKRLLRYHRGFVEDEPERIYDVNTELQAVLYLLENIGGCHQPQES